MKVESTHGLTNRYNVDPYFTDDEAKNCKIVSTTSVLHDGTHNYWDFELEDENGNTYVWRDYSVSGTASKSDIKTAILNHLVDNVIKLQDDGFNDHDYKKTTSAPADRGAGELLGE